MYDSLTKIIIRKVNKIFQQCLKTQRKAIPARGKNGAEKFLRV
jgi:hypothetical protein